MLVFCLCLPNVELHTDEVYHHREPQAHSECRSNGGGKVDPTGIATDSGRRMNGKIDVPKVLGRVDALGELFTEFVDVCHHGLDLITSPYRIIGAYVCNDLTGTKHYESGGDWCGDESDGPQHPLSVFPGLTLVVYAHTRTSDDKGGKGVVPGLGIEFAAKSTSSDDGAAESPESYEEDSGIAIDPVENHGSPADSGNELEDGKNAARYGAINVEEDAWLVHFFLVPEPFAGDGQVSDIVGIHHEGAGQTKSDKSSTKDDQEYKTEWFFETKNPGDVPVGSRTEFFARLGSNDGHVEWGGIAI